MPYHPGGISTLGRSNTIYPAVNNIGDGRWFTTHRNWHLSSGEPDDYGRLPPKAVFASHDCDDNAGRHFWADTIEEAVAAIDAMPDYGDQDWDYRR